MKNCLYFCRFYYALISLCRMDARLFDDEQLKADSIRGWDSIVHFENSPDQAKKTLCSITIRGSHPHDREETVR